MDGFYKLKKEKKEDSKVHEMWEDCVLAGVLLVYVVPCPASLLTCFPCRSCNFAPSSPRCGVAILKTELLIQDVLLLIVGQMEIVLSKGQA